VVGVRSSGRVSACEIDVGRRYVSANAVEIVIVSVTARVSECVLFHFCAVVRSTAVVVSGIVSEHCPKAVVVIWLSNVRERATARKMLSGLTWWLSLIDTKHATRC